MGYLRGLVMLTRFMVDGSSLTDEGSKFKGESPTDCGPRLVGNRKASY